MGSPDSQVNCRPATAIFACSLLTRSALTTLALCQANFRVMTGADLKVVAPALRRWYVDSDSDLNASVATISDIHDSDEHADGSPTGR